MYTYVFCTKNLPNQGKYSKLRRLAKIEQQKGSVAVPRIHRFYKLLFGIITAVFGIILATNCTDNIIEKHFEYIKIIGKNFARNYRNQYKEIVHGRVDYCNRYQLVDVSRICAGFKELNILHQTSALQQLQRSLVNDTDFNAIAIVGGVGVGKSLVVRAISANFPWPDNVNNYVWNTHVFNDYEKFHRLRIIIDQLSDCGYNLLVIDNLRAKDYVMVNTFNKRIAESVYGAKRVIVIYVFSLSAMITTNDFLTQRQLLYDNLPNTTVITFEAFNKKKLKDCIQREAVLENVSLSSEDIDEITNAVDPYFFGCKNVKAKVLLYSSFKPKPLK